VVTGCGGSGSGSQVDAITMPDTSVDAGHDPGQIADHGTDQGALDKGPIEDTPEDQAAPQDVQQDVQQDVPVTPPDAEDEAIEDSGKDQGIPDLGQDAGGDTSTGDPGSGDTGGKHHPTGWATPGNDPFHGNEAKKGLGACEACHGADLLGGSVGVSCDSCHSGWKTNCVFCHGGTDNQLGSPPVDIHGDSAATLVTVGAHTSHVMAKAGISPAFDCVKCHVKPADALAAGHIDPSPAEVLPANGWDHGATTCSSAYCHGNFTGGTATNHPNWTKSGQGQAACGTCHALPPQTGRHPSNFGKHAFMGTDCTNCHNGIVNSTATTILNPALHVNGTKDVSLKNGGSWNATAKTCDPSCHGSENW